MIRRTTTALSAAVALAASLTLAGCSTSDAADGAGTGGPELKVSGAFMPQPVRDMAGGFLTITNSGDTADKLTSVTSGLTDDVTIHETKDQKMRKVASLDIPANGELKLERGGDHLMFMELRKQPKQGEKVDIELHFEKSGPIKVTVPVEAPNFDPEHAPKPR